LLPPCYFLSFYSSLHHQNLHSFPTRRSSDLETSAASRPSTPIRSSAGPPAAGCCTSDRSLSSGASGPGRSLPYWAAPSRSRPARSEEHTSELQSQSNLVCRLLLEKKKKKQ